MVLQPSSAQPGSGPAPDGVGSTPDRPGSARHGHTPAPAPGALSVDELSERLRTRGLRVTGPRLVVYKTLAQQRGHRSADEVAAAISAAGPSLPRTSVYNALKALVNAGLIDVVDAGPGTTLYEVRGAAHHHFICRQCNALIDVPSEASLEGRLLSELPGAEVESAQVVLRGVCPDCVTGR